MSNKRPDTSAGQSGHGTLYVDQMGSRPGGYANAVTSADGLVCFIYLLGRDHLSLGVIEELVFKSSPLGEITFSNDFLAAYAIECAARLRGRRPEAALQCARGALVPNSAGDAL